MSTLSPGVNRAQAPGLADEDIARADLYGLLARLFHSPPDDTIIRALAASPTDAADDTVLSRAWGELARAARASDAQGVRQEYEDVFIGVGKPEVFLFASFYLAGYLNEKPLVDLRNALGRLGLARAEQANETEDHIAALCEVMRFLITADDQELAKVATQREFFSTFLRPWVGTMVAEIEASNRTRFYRHVAGLLEVLCEVEAEAFEIE